LFNKIRRAARLRVVGWQEAHRSAEQRDYKENHYNTAAGGHRLESFDNPKDF
jgi:hypothetical protein